MPTSTGTTSITGAPLAPVRDPAAPTSAAMPQRFGRFVVRRLLGKGAQSLVYLAFDSQLEREVAIKTVALRPPNGAQGQGLLGEARTVARLRHTNIVPVFEAGEHGGDAYLVFEYIEGRTLDQMLGQDGPQPPSRAAELMVGILDAIGEAHQQGVVHRDLKPSNVLVNAQGLPKVMDFGIAAPLAAMRRGEDRKLSGTPAYMAPEYIAGQPFTAQCDVFAAGLLLYELVFGRRQLQGASVFQILHQIANQDLELPRSDASPVDEALRNIIAKATARNPQMRYQSAADMRKALDAYLRPLPEAEAEQPGGGGTLDFLLRRMRLRSDFPAMSSAISAITRLASADSGDVNTLSNSILKDFALTSKILRVANSVYYRHVGGGINTVSRAIVVLGFTTLRNIALSLMFFEHLQNKQHAELLREEFLRVTLSGTLAQQLAQRVLKLEPEASFICAQFHTLGRLLTHYYFPEEASAIARLAAKEGGGEEAAAARVLGIGFQDLGIGIARSWGFPESIITSMERLPADKVPKPQTKEDRLRILSGYANEYFAAMEAPAQERPAELARFKARFGDSMTVSDQQLAAAVEKSIEDVTELARVVRVDFGQTRIGRTLLQQQGANGVESKAKQPGVGELPGAAAAVCAPDPGEADGRAGSIDKAPYGDAASILAQGIQDLSSALLEAPPLSTLLGIALETLYRAFGFQRVLLCMRDGRSGTMAARLGFGSEVDQLLPRFRFALADSQDIFNLALAREVDVLITDASAAKIAPHIPDWHRRDIGALAFIICPLRIRQVPVAMIYADKNAPGSITISAEELGLLRALRNQVILAIKQAA